MTCVLHIQVPWDLIIQSTAAPDVIEQRFTAVVNDAPGEITVKKNHPLLDFLIQGDRQQLLNELDFGWKCSISSVSKNTEQGQVEMPVKPVEKEDANITEKSQISKNSQISEQSTSLYKMEMAGESTEEEVEFRGKSASESEETRDNGEIPPVKKKRKKGAPKHPVVVCPLCLNSFTVEGNLEKHLLKFHNIQWNIYKEASKDSSEINTIREQILRLLSMEENCSVKELPAIEQCCICLEAISASGRSRSAHLRRHHNLTLEEYQGASEMGEEDRERFLKQRENSKAEKTEMKQHCSVCDKNFSSLSSLKFHVKTMHSNDPNAILELEKKRSAHNTSAILMQCPLCSEKRHGKAIFRHFKDIHHQHEQYSELFTSLEKLHKMASLEHERINYKEKQLLQSASCKFCRQQFPHRWARARHQNKCALNPSPQKKYHCSVCMRSYVTKEKLEVHKKEHPEDGRYFCEHCGKSYKNKSGLYIHLRKAHNIEMKASNFKHECATCERKFFDKYSLRIHIKRAHAEVRDCICSHCGNCFKTDGDLKKHIRSIHQNIYKYRCSKCGHGVNRKSYLDTHQCDRVKRIQSEPVVPVIHPPLKPPSLIGDNQYKVFIIGPSVDPPSNTETVEDPAGMKSYSLLGPVRTDGDQSTVL